MKLLVQSGCHLRNMLCIAGIVGKSCHCENNQRDDKRRYRSNHHITDVTEQGSVCDGRRQDSGFG